ncbi:MAG: RNase adapter RapZ, partial [Pseudomonadota bacterium]
MTDEPSPGAEPSAQNLLLLTGLSGAGKSTVLGVLEDLGWETIDNFPVRFLESLVGSAPDPARASQAPLAIGFDTRTRGFVPADIIELGKSLAARDDIATTFLFLDCASGELERRYNETRRRHPMARDRAVHEAIKAERELLEPLRRWADMVIDTSVLSTNELQGHVRDLFAKSAQG